MKIHAVVVMALLIGAGPNRALAQGNLPGKLPPIQIVGAGQLYPIAVSGLKDLGGDGGHSVSGVFDTTLTRDPKLSSFFRVIDSQAYIEDPQTSGYDIGQFNFGDWRSINAEFLVKGSVTRQAGKITGHALPRGIVDGERGPQWMSGGQPAGEDGFEPELTPARQFLVEASGKLCREGGSERRRSVTGEAFRCLTRQVRRGNEVDPSSDHRVIAFTLQQQAAELGAPKQHVVRPLELEQRRVRQAR